MNKLNKSSCIHKIDRKWVREEQKIFSEYPGLPRTDGFGEEENWLELIQFYCNDIRWLLSLEHHKFWSHMIYSEKAHDLLISFLKECLPVYLKNNFLFREDTQNAFSEIEHLVFLVFIRLSTEKESENCFIRNFGEIIYNNYLFTVPIILDICLIYGTSNHDLVKTMINNVIMAAPDFLDDFQEIIPHFVHVLKIVKEKFSVLSKEERSDLKSNEIQDLIIYLCDSVATIQIFFDLYSNVCQLFSKGELINEIIYFYSNVLPKMLNHWSKKYQSPSENLFICNLIENIRIDLLKIVKSIFDFILNDSDTNEILKKNEKVIYEYLDLMTKLLSEPTFLFDYNLIYSVEYEIGYAVKNCQNLDLIKVNHILEEVALIVSGNEKRIKENMIFQESDDSKIKLNSLITEIKDIFPHLKESFIKQCLSYYNNSTEKVIVAVLENHVLPDLDQNKKNGKSEMLESGEKFKNKHENLNKVLDDREYLSKIKERYMQLTYKTDENYDDEYDDTYDEHLDISVREGEEVMRRPFVVPRVLRTGGDDEYDEIDDSEGKEEKEVFVEDGLRRDCFLENPAILRERMEGKRSERKTRDVLGRGRGQGQSKQVFRNREFKESHKFSIGNHNRKKQASKKMSRGIVPF